MALPLKCRISSSGAFPASRAQSCMSAHSALRSFRNVSGTTAPACNSSLNKKQRALAVIAHSRTSFSNHSTNQHTGGSPNPLSSDAGFDGSSGSMSSFPGTAAAAEAAALLRLPVASGEVFEESDDETAAPVHVHLGSRIEQDDLFCGQGTFDGNNYDAQDWEEMSNLLSFDGEEHKYVTRKMPGVHMRVEDMFASFDGDDFEAVMHAARGGEPTADSTAAETEAILAAAGASIDAAAAATVTTGGGVGSSSSSKYQSAAGEDTYKKQGEESLFLTVSRRRAAAMAAELQSKKNPKPKRRKAPLGSEPGDAWLFEEPEVAVGPPQGLSLQLYKAAQRALLPPLLPANAAAAEGSGTAGAARELQQVSEVVVVVVQRPEASEGVAAPAPHAVEQQEVSSLGVTHHLLSSSRSSSAGGNNNSIRRAAAALEVARPNQGAAARGSGAAVVQVSSSSSNSRGAAMPAAAAPEGLLGLTAVAAATVATQQLQPEELRRCSSRVLATPAALDPLAVAPATLGAAAAAAGSLSVFGAAAELKEELHDEVRTRLPALPSRDEDEEVAAQGYDARASVRERLGSCWADAGVGSEGAAADSKASSSSSSSNKYYFAGQSVGDVGARAAAGGVVNGNAHGLYVPDRRQAGRVALKRALTALIKLQGSRPDNGHDNGTS